jgi:hypothetical protein
LAIHRVDHFRSKFGGNPFKQGQTNFKLSPPRPRARCRARRRRRAPTCAAVPLDPQVEDGLGPLVHARLCRDHCGCLAHQGVVDRYKGARAVPLARLRFPADGLLCRRASLKAVAELLALLAFRANARP